MPARITPMMHVPDVRATADWYTSIGFRLERTYEDCGECSWALLSYGESEIMLNAGGVPSDAARREFDLYIQVDDVEAVSRHLSEKVEVVEPLYDAFHGMREFIIRDCNRFWITFGTPMR